MKILCLGDVHLGSGADYGRTPFGEGSRLEDQERVLRRILHLTIEEKVDAILNAGDVFHRRRPTPSEMMVWRGFVELAGDEGIPIVGVLGNHDVEAADRPTALDVIRGSGYCDTFARPGITWAFQEHGVVVACLPWTPPARLVATMDGSVPRDEVNTVCAELLIDSARELRAQIPEEATAILLAHWSVSGSSLPNGLPVDQLREPVLPLADLEELGFDVIVLGHIHKAQVLSTSSPVFYTGSPACVDFGEARTGHGVWIYDTETQALRHHEIFDRRFVTVDVDLTNNFELGTLDGVEHETYDPRVDEDETDLIAAMIAEQFPLTDAVVRVRYRCTPEQARRVDTAALRSLILDAGASKVYALQADVVREDRARVEGVDEHMGELQALDAWVNASFQSVARHEELRTLTSRYLEELAA